MPLMHIPTEISKIESAVLEAGETIPDFCKRAGINLSTWNRWKAGSHEPQMRSWFRVQDAVPRKRGKAA